MCCGIDGVADFGKVFLHRLGVAPGQHEARAFALLGTDGAEDVGPHGSLVRGCGWPGSATRPAPRDLVLLAYSSAHQSSISVPCGSLALFCERGGEVFLKAAASSSF